MSAMLLTPLRRLAMDLIHIDWLPLRFWLAALGSTSLMLLGLLAVGAIDDGTGDDGTVAALLQDASAAQCRTPATLAAAVNAISPQ
ncbi:hypothetical protein [Reyranella sp. CPCC 100927]|uniref:hypothetical protein n=1 Tax=Reyranella sp. CPCC 100927 TaxID=2599616 RepID=UPI0011B706F8|nr:hypothetical protein [Reyranella sp. CPCC 100927]TWT14842.1 hypothetical protein FQU96_00295 [Reyranella sp. CPCC 100927]